MTTAVAIAGLAAATIVYTALFSDKDEDATGNETASYDSERHARPPAAEPLEWTHVRQRRTMHRTPHVSKNADETRADEPNVIALKGHDVIHDLCSGHIEADDMRAVSIIPKIAYSPLQAIHPSDSHSVWVLHRQSADGPPHYLKIDASTTEKQLDRVWVQGVPRIVHFSFRDQNSALVHVYSISGSARRGDFLADGAYSFSLRVLGRSQKLNHVVRSNQLGIQHHEGIVAYGGDAYDLIQRHMGAATKKPDRVCLYGHSLGGSSAMIVAHKLHSMRADPEFGVLDSSASIECRTISSPNYVAGISEISLRATDLGDRFHMVNYANAGDAVIFNALFKRFTYPVDFTSGVGDPTGRSSHGITVWGDFDPGNVLGLSLANVSISPLISARMAVIFHSQVFADGQVFCTEEDYDAVAPTIRFMWKRIKRALKRRKESR